MQIEKVRIRLKAEPEKEHYPVHLLLWALSAYKHEAVRPKLIKVLREYYGFVGFSEECILDLLTGTVKYTIEGDDVVFEYPADRVFDKNKKMVPVESSKKGLEPFVFYSKIKFVDKD